MKPCPKCGKVDPNSPCPNLRDMPPDTVPHSVGDCPAYQNAQIQMEKMDALEHAWRIIKGKEDAPNYRKATGPKKCGNCKAWDSSKTDDPMTGYCEWYDFTCRADHVCDAWAGKE